MSVENKQRLVDELIDRAISGQLKLPTEATFDLADILKAVDGKVQAEKKGKVLLKPYIFDFFELLTMAVLLLGRCHCLFGRLFKHSDNTLKNATILLVSFFLRPLSA